MSDTPRTDAEYLFKSKVSENPCAPNEHSEWMASLCRKLERENAELREFSAWLENEFVSKEDFAELMQHSVFRRGIELLGTDHNKPNVIIT